MDYKRLDGKTPSGGDYSEIYYLDENNNLADESKAKRCRIRECRADGTLLNEITGFCNNEH